MKRTLCLMKLLFALCLLGTGQFISAQSQGASSPHSLKGYELYSWRIDGNWCFSLLVGTNRLKTRDEVTAQNSRLLGVEALKNELHRLPKGEEVIWSAGLMPRMALPAAEVIKELKVYCNERGIKLQVNDPREPTKKQAAQKGRE